MVKRLELWTKVYNNIVKIRVNFVDSKFALLNLFFVLKLLEVYIKINNMKIVFLVFLGNYVYFTLSTIQDKSMKNNLFTRY